MGYAVAGLGTIGEFDPSSFFTSAHCDDIGASLTACMKFAAFISDDPTIGRDKAEAGCLRAGAVLAQQLCATPGPSPVNKAAFVHALTRGRPYVTPTLALPPLSPAAKVAGVSIGAALLALVFL